VSRSDHHACGRSCGVCKPHKKWRGNRQINRTTQERRAVETHQLDPDVERELDDLDKMYDLDEDWTLEWWLDWKFGEGISTDEARARRDDQAAPEVPVLRHGDGREGQDSR
jgi:hypothetical protein